MSCGCQEEMAVLSRKHEQDFASLDELSDHLTNEVQFCQSCNRSTAWAGLRKMETFSKVFTILKVCNLKT